MKRLLLFDIDGTILSTEGAARRAFMRALVDVYGTAGPLEDHPFDGKTDPQIARELMGAAGFGDADIDARLADLWDRYLAEFATEMAATDYHTRVYPGVREVLKQLAAHDDVVLGLLTGNIARGAALKLGSAGLDHYFRLGAFGSDCEQRHGLPQIAVDRARELTGRAFSGKDVIVIGDTPSDVHCGRSLGVFALGVATGRHGRAELLAAGADEVFEDLSNTPEVLRVLLPDA